VEELGSSSLGNREPDHTFSRAFSGMAALQEVAGWMY